MPEIRPRISRGLLTEAPETEPGGAVTPSTSSPFVATASPVDALSPSLAEMSEQRIQELVKARVPREALASFLDKRITEQSMESVRKLIEIRGDLYAIPGENVSNLEANNSQRKRLFDMAMVALYEELMTPQKIVSVILGLGVVNAADLLEKMAVVEYGIYYLARDISSTSTFTSDPLYVYDSIAQIHHSDPTRNSYQSLANVEEELLSVYEDTLGAGPLPSDITTLLADFDYKALVRINGREAACEGSNIARYKFLLNYTSTSQAMDRSLLRKYWATTSDGAGGTYGYYVRDNRRIYLTGLKASTGGLEDYAYYGLLASAYNAGHKAARDFLYALWNNTASRTIHY